MSALILLLLLVMLMLMLSVGLCLSDDEVDAHLGRICGVGVVAART